ncbi:MAG: nucleoside hydrolase [Bryobacterales bacterium]|nr:nucleoside hydrolase [Bryobacterales bacterium]
MLLRLAGCLICCAVLLAGAQPIPVILDTDIGDDIDDALALALALQSPELDVRAVCTVLQHGEKRADLAWKILSLFGRRDIPVGMGAEEPLVAPSSNAVVRQTQALGPGDAMPSEARRNGVRLAIDTILQSPRKITWLAYGPLTNLGIALRAEPRIRRNIERIVLMNGVFFRPGVEYNTQRDPEAARIVFTSGLPVVTVGLDVTMQCRLALEDLKAIETSPHASVRFLDRIIKIWQGGRPEQRPILHDPLAVAIAFRPGLVRTVTGRVDLELRGDPRLTYGMTLLREDPKGFVQVAREVDAAAFVRLFVERVTAAPRSR